MKVLFIGGTGIISSACAELAVARGMDVYLLNRGQSVRKPAVGATVLTADVRDRDAVERALGDMTFDAVAEFLAYEPAHIESDLESFRGRTSQYVFISSASAYETPPSRLPVTEDTPLENPFWDYSRGKIACEERLVKAGQESGFPYTIVRPSHTYDRMSLPFYGRYTIIDRMRAGRPVIVHGDGTSIWALTHHRDFAVGFVGLLGNERALGEAIHITNDELLTWNGIFRTLAEAAGAEARIVHVPSDTIARYNPEWGAGLLGDKAHSMVFDNTKIKRLVPEFAALDAIPYTDGAREIMAWFDAHSSRRAVDDAVNREIDGIIEDVARLGAG
jgi:nucleoside-diphosphate-sugar epimerase